MTKTSKKNTVPWYQAEEKIVEEAVWLRQSIQTFSLGDEEKDAPVKCRECLARKIAVLIVSGKVLASEITKKPPLNSFWMDKSECSNRHSPLPPIHHGGEWHRETMERILTISSLLPCHEDQLPGVEDLPIRSFVVVRVDIFHAEPRSFDQMLHLEPEEVAHTKTLLQHSHGKNIVRRCDEVAELDVENLVEKISPHNFGRAPHATTIWHRETLVFHLRYSRREPIDIGVKDINDKASAARKTTVEAQKRGKLIFNRQKDAGTLETEQ